MKIVTILVTVLCVVFSFAWTQSTGGHSGIDPESIEPLHENAGDFLDVDVLQYKQKALELYNEQEYLEAAKYYLAALHFNVNDFISLYNLACCYGLMGEEQLAALFLKKSVRAGYEDIEHIKQDPDFDKVRGQVVFDAAVDTIAKNMEEKQKALGNVLFSEAPVLLKCRMHVPQDYNPAEHYTLIVGLHGYGSNVDNFITLWKRFGEDRFIYVAPQAPYPFPVGTNVGYSWALWTENGAISSTAMNLSEEYVCQVVETVCMQYNIDKVYLMGFSQGCGLTYRTGIKHHHLFQGLICFGGWLATDWIPEHTLKESRGLRIFIAHGKKDNSVKFSEAEHAFKILKEHEYDVIFEPFDGGHAVPEDIMKKAILWIDKEGAEGHQE